MPVTTTDAARLTGLSYDELINWARVSAQSSNFDIDKWIEVANQYDVSEMEALENLANNYMDFYQNGDGTYTVTQFKNLVQDTSVNPINSNTSTISRGGISQMLNRGKDALTGKLNITKFPIQGSFAQQASYFLGSVGGAYAATSTGIALGKVISPLLYDAAPNFWESIGVSEGSFDPENWNHITNGDDSNFAGLFNLILGLDPETGKTQAYMDENAFAYMAYAMSQNGVFDASFEPTTPVISQTYTQDDMIWMTAAEWLLTYGVLFPTALVDYSSVTVARWLEMHPEEYNAYGVLGPKYSINGIEIPSFNVLGWDSIPSLSIQVQSAQSGNNYQFSPEIRSYGGHYVYISSRGQIFISGRPQTSTNVPIRLCCAYGTPRVGAGGGTVIAFAHSVPSVEGISNQPNATLPDISTWNDIPSTLQSLQQQYPDLWNDSLLWDNVQPDGTNPQLRYIPVPTPTALSGTDTQPVTGTQTQTDTQIDPTTSTDTLVKLITELITKTQTDTNTEIPPENPVDTGTGNSPTPVPPSGSASALWAVYHPTQAQVNAFGAWLWSNDFVDQLLKVFQNPMDAIISLHKVFISPVDAGSTTIHAGYLDSEVPSNYVTQQYVYKDCGYVNCYEVFGNVFDYVGTSVSLYLPFIGIVPLNVDEVMRSTIHVTYGCDLFTGAILVQVEISRDGNDVVMYQYGGDGGVQYPVSGSRSSGFLTGLAATIGAAASIATGGAALPAFAAAFGGSVMSAQKQVQHSGGFSGNSGAMGGKTPYLIIERPQTKVAQLFPSLSGYPTNKSGKLSEFEGQVVVSDVHVEGMSATDTELSMIEDLLKEGVLL